MKIILFNASSIDGIIARKNGNEDFLSDENWNEFCKLVINKKCLILSRRAYETTKNYNISLFDKVTKIVVSKKQKIKLAKGWIYASSPKNAIEIAKSKRYKETIFTAGEKLNNCFLHQNLIDELIINLEPVIAGKGIRIFSEKFNKKLKLIKSKKLDKVIIQLHYKLK
ncbi:dihydrofolate reductase family protein [Candidatus Pacearchaeota archaeon]|nr:dihydrofolate reductase family protein [Candidatus Pacearchaeota archaeon]